MSNSNRRRAPLRRAMSANSTTQQELRRQELAASFADLGDVVYIVRHLDCVKIGHSRNLRQRLYTLRAKPEDLLLVLPGGAVAEAELHDRFASLRAVGWAYGQECFLLAGDLLAFVNEKRAAIGMEALAA